MDRKKWTLIVLVSVTVTFCAVTAVIASPQTCNTPLYTFRMEQASNEMNFLPTEVNTFTYTTERGYNLNYNGVGKYCADVQPNQDTFNPTCNPTCNNPWTCIYSTCTYTCEYTCDPTCNGPWTCIYSTCQPFCNPTMEPTCYDPWTCDHSTCKVTCDPTCDAPWTCFYSTCDPLSTCLQTCEPTCYDPWTCQYSTCNLC